MVNLIEIIQLHLIQKKLSLKYELIRKTTLSNKPHFAMFRKQFNSYFKANCFKWLDARENITMMKVATVCSFHCVNNRVYKRESCKSLTSLLYARVLTIEK